MHPRERQLCGLHSGTRNLLPLPRIQHEELWSGPLEVAGLRNDWSLSVNTYDRLYNHHTLGSIRKNYHLKAPLIPKDSLDFVLTAVYKGEDELFAESSDVVRQNETIGRETWRLLKNRKKELTKKEENFIHSLQMYGRQIKKIQMPMSNYEDEAENPNSMEFQLNRRLLKAGHSLRKQGFGNHGLTYGGYTKRVHPSSLKVGIVSPHSAQTNNGYGREVDGAFFCY